MNLKKIATNTKNKITETFNKLILEASKTPHKMKLKYLREGVRSLITPFSHTQSQEL